MKAALNTPSEIEQLAKAIAANIAPQLPLDITLWNATKCADYLDAETKTFANRYAPLPSFPRPIKADTVTGRGNPRWIAQEVIDWFLSHRDEAERRRRPRNAAK